MTVKRSCRECTATVRGPVYRCAKCLREVCFRCFEEESGRCWPCVPGLERYDDEAPDP